MEHEHMNPETGTLKDFDIVAHIVKVDGKSFRHAGDEYQVRALYINRYGLEIGALVQDVKTNDLHSWDPCIWEEYIHYMSEGESGRY